MTVKLVKVKERCARDLGEETLAQFEDKLRYARAVLPVSLLLNVNDQRGENETNGIQGHHQCQK